jgi:hypothetical protein
MWFPFAGVQGLTGIAGLKADSVITYQQSETTTWDKWVADHPCSKFMKEPY